MNSVNYQYFLSVNSQTDYPVDYYYVDIIDANNNTIGFSCDKTYYGEWGVSPYEISCDEEYPLPKRIFAQWLSAIEKKFYLVDVLFPPVNDETFLKVITSDYEFCIVVGLAPYGGLSLWIRNEKKSMVIMWVHGLEVENQVANVFPNLDFESVDEYYEKRIINNSYFKQDLETNGLPPCDLFDNYMMQFTYRYLPLFEHWGESEEMWQPYSEEEQETKPELDYIEESLYDGTHDKLHDGGLLKYHEAGKPKKLAMKWHIKKSEYTAYFWFEDKAICTFFNKFYDIHPDTKTDFIIHVDPMKNKYQLALYRYGLKEPQIIPKETYQLIVFKNKFEQFRSENFDQPRGAWIW